MDMKKFWWLKAGIALAGRLMIPTVPYTEGYFLEEAKKFRAALSMPLIYVGGLVSRHKMEEVLDAGFTGLQVARAPRQGHRLRGTSCAAGEMECSACGHSNYCIGRMYTLEMKCHSCVHNLPPSLEKGSRKAEEKWKNNDARA